MPSPQTQSPSTADPVRHVADPVSLRRNLRSRRLHTLCIGCNLCRPTESYVNVGFRHRGAQLQAVAGDFLM
jgi:hypothetical protein